MPRNLFSTMLELKVKPVNESVLGVNDKKRYEVELRHLRNRASHAYKNVIIRLAFSNGSAMPNAKIITNGLESKIAPELGTERVLVINVPEADLSGPYDDNVPSDANTPIYSIMVEINTGVPTLEDTTSPGSYMLEVQMEFNDVVRIANLQDRIPVSVV